MSSSHYTVSLHYDRRLYRHDIAGSIAHAQMLARAGTITEKDADLIVDGLKRVRQEIEEDSFPWDTSLEDLHMNIESRLHQLIGSAAGRLHTGRSRNDQIALDMRMYTKEVIIDTVRALRGVQRSLVERGQEFREVVMPGYTHLQRAQPVLFAHHLLAYFQMFERDIDRFRDCYRRADVLPLGSGALAGVAYPTDRKYLAKELNFSRISANSMDAVSDRDFVLEYLSSAATCMMHLSRMGEELVLWSSREFAFIRLAEEFTTGSSIMPQKRNPDFAELARGKTGAGLWQSDGAVDGDEGPALDLQPGPSGRQRGGFRHGGYFTRHAGGVPGYAFGVDPGCAAGDRAGRRQLRAGHRPCRLSGD